MRLVKDEEVQGEQNSADQGATITSTVPVRTGTKRPSSSKLGNKINIFEKFMAEHSTTRQPDINKTGVKRKKTTEPELHNQKARSNDKQQNLSETNNKTIDRFLVPQTPRERMRLKSETKNKTQPSLLEKVEGGGKIYENSRAKSCSSTGKSEQGQGVADIRAFLAKKKLEREQKVLLGNNLGVTEVLASSEQTRGCSRVFSDK